MTTAAPNKTSTTTLSDIIKFVLAGIALLAFGWFVCHMLGQTKTNETEWTRAVYLFQGVEAIAFAAAGFIFGKEVHRERADKAEKRANAKEEEAAKGKALAEIVKSKAQNHPVRAAATFGANPSAHQAAVMSQPDFDELAIVASRLFP